MSDKSYTCECCNRKFDEEEYKLTNDEDKCILHCKKDDWYTIKNEEKDWSESSHAISNFWKVIRLIILKRTDEKDYQMGDSVYFSYIVFPKFEDEYVDIEEYDENDRQCIDWHHNFFDMKIINSEYPSYESNIRFNFNNSVFLDVCYFSGYKFKDCVYFNNVKFLEKVILFQTDFNQVSFKNTVFYKELKFESSNVNFYTFESGDFENSIFHNKVEFYNSTFGHEKSRKEFDIDFKGAQFKKEAKFISCKFDKGLRFFKDSECKALSIGGGNIPYLHIAGSIPTIVINGNEKEFSELIIKHNNLKTLILHNITIGSDFLLNDKQYRKNDEFKLDLLHLKESTFKGKVKIQFYEIKKADFYNTKFDDLADFYQTEFNEVVFKRTDFKDISVFSECEFDCDVDFKYTKFLGKAIFRDTVIKGKLDLRNTIFDDEANFLDITSKKREKINDQFIGKIENIKVANRETARVIKNFYDNTNNIIEANRFYKLEMEKREKELNETKKENFFEYLIFLFHSISSNHSQNWLLPLFWIIVSTFGYSLLSCYEFSNNIIYGAWIGISIILVIAIGIFLKNYIDDTFTHTTLMFIFGFLFYLAYGFTNNDLSLNKFSNNINPFSIMSEFSDITFLTLVYKITIAYLIYQLIISIRQNTRRK